MSEPESKKPNETEAEQAKSSSANVEESSSTQNEDQPKGLPGRGSESVNQPPAIPVQVNEQPAEQAQPQQPYTPLEYQYAPEEAQVEAYTPAPYTPPAEQPYQQQPPQQLPPPQLHQYGQPQYSEQQPYNNQQAQYPPYFGEPQQGAYYQQQPNQPYGQQSAAPVYQSNQYSTIALTCSIAGIVLCCCMPISISLGVVGAAMGHKQMQIAKENGSVDMIALLAYWLGIAAISISVLFTIQQIVSSIFNPVPYDQLMQDLGL
ncbi:MAG: hypothetical protein ACFCU1_13770 [Sumerlaeia bacterium]